MGSLLALSDMERAALALSLNASALAILASLPLAVACGLLLARRPFFGQSLLNVVVHLPLVLPPVVIGYLLLLVLGRNGPIGGLLDMIGVRIAFTPRAVVIACAVVAFPLLVRAIRQAFEGIDPRYGAAARSLGASEVRVFATITLPLLAPGILTGMTLGFARAVGEFGATITLAGNIPGLTQTLPLALYTVAQTPGGDAAAARLCLLSIALAGAAILGSEMLARRVHTRVATC